MSHIDDFGSANAIPQASSLLEARVIKLERLLPSKTSQLTSDKKRLEELNEVFDAQASETSMAQEHVGLNSNVCLRMWGGPIMPASNHGLW